MSFFNGNPAFIFSSDSVKTQGDEAGTGKGIKSGTKGAKSGTERSLQDI